MALEDVTLAVLGVGNMGAALCRGVLKAGLIPADRLVVADKAADRAAQLAADEGARAAASNREAVAHASVVIIAVKPQDVHALMAEVGGGLGPDTLLISIAAGVATAYFESLMPAGARVVRAMPNTPALVGLGAVGLAAGAHASADDVELARTLFASMAEVVVVDDEGLIDAVTAVSGSGPAYIFYLVEAMVAAGVAEGLSESDALVLARRTALGAGALLERSGEPPAVLRQRVTSPGGTTQAAIERLDQAHVRDLLIAAVRRAAERSRELGR